VILISNAGANRKFSKLPMNSGQAAPATGVIVKSSRIVRELHALSGHRSREEREENRRKNFPPSPPSRSSRDSFQLGVLAVKPPATGGAKNTKRKRE
jgi:hypothetical protein